MKQPSLSAILGNLLRIPAAAGLVLFGATYGQADLFLMPAQAQLPPVNMGKFVHQPGDNQYSAGTQNDRHGSPAPSYQVVNPNPQQMQGPAGWQRTPHKGGDISLEPIVCDEPIAIAGFPPIPDNLDLPGIKGGMFTGGGSGGGGGGGRPGSYGGGGGQLMAGGGGGQSPGMMPPPESHQGYTTFAPGSFRKGNTTGKGAELYSSGDGASRGGGGGGNGDGGGGGMSSSQRQLNRMGKEPGLDKDGGAAPEAPQAVQVNQATTQDLSLPDDEAQNNGQRKSQNQLNRGVNRFARRAGQQIMRPLYTMPIQMPNLR